ncbi:MAG: PIG-L family deacetylase [Nitrososphaeria archaeon]|nr:PIG-L family deacetylase [Nitrososphaeria archaeon]
MEDPLRVFADVMVVTPHPDDAEYGVAGTVAHWVREGRDVVYVVCTNGDKGTLDAGTDPEKLARIREREQKAACRILGVKEVIFLRHPDQGIEDTPEFRKEIVILIRKYRPEIVTTIDPHQHYNLYVGHRDHRITGQVTLDAVFPYARNPLSYPDLIKEGLKPHKVREVLLWAMDNINYRSDITDTFDLKMAALRCHKSQIGSGERVKQLEEQMRQWHQRMAEGENFELAEAFHRIEISY